MTRLFGTDGVRGVANKDLTPELAFKLGRAGAHVLAQNGGAKRLVVGRDTRISGDMLEAALAAGICSAGVDVLSVGFLPTPAVAFLTREFGAAGGVVISASHNPVEDNGIKFFGPSGYKLPDDKEIQVEQLITGTDTGIPSPVGPAVGRINRVEDAEDRYVNFLKSTVSADLKGLKIVMDCANGSSYRVAPRVLSELGAEVIPIHNTPDGVNINEKCGSTHPDKLRETVVREGADLGLANDGDADRLIAVDHRGNLVDGDQIMVICANHLKAQHRLPKNTVVVTVMSNMGLHLAMRESGIEVLQTKVGDRYVVEELLRTGAVFGGEQSGHILFLEHSPSGDGVLTALQLLSVVKATGQSLAELAARMERLPQLLENVRVADKQRVMSSPVLAKSIRKKEEHLAGQGRILVRPSGTESLVRVMAEGRDMGQLQEIVGELVDIVKQL
ncbi:phosphoglucosamine mutase [Desulfotomaculum arcticum]|uniref:Phosphoglucosamine mutase n=1 Tax=Desulfotruncus arcticus DSM 17038 TaxID=1121424 RepID=A0A1I2WTV2_9FIRM|nr:phosphoglucosamine mutase [Desulfotruncus arcticus]SFH04764.1 phosphoglucosamine mutase [Desulfotomaculum arcticum] [Desulfotruncus arcticus DSM 17038]